MEIDMGLSIQDWGAIGELAGAILLFFSLTYVGFQIQQARKSMRVAAAQARVDSEASVLSAWRDASFAELVASTQNSSLKELSVRDRVRLGGFFHPLIEITLNSFYQRKLGVLDQDQAIFLESLPLLSDGIGYQMWQNLRSESTYPKDFVDHVDQVIEHARLQPPRSYL